MAGGFLNPTFASGGIEHQFQASEQSPGQDDTLLHPPRWSYQSRSVRSTYDRNKWSSLWPQGGFISGNPSTAMTPLGDDYAEGGGHRLGFEMPSVGIQGSQNTKFIRGSCIDASSVAVASATVKAYLTATDVEVGSGVSFDDGTYAVGTDNPVSAQHYVVAYKAGAPDIAGTSVNTLTPTNIDGT